MSNSIQFPSILFVDQSGEMGGAELSLFDIVNGRPHNSKVVLLADGIFHERLQAAGIDVEVLPIGKAGRISRGGGVISALFAIPVLLGTALRLAKRARRYDVVYANTQKAFVVSALAATLARRPLVWHLRDILTATHFSFGLRKTVIVLANHLANCVIANSEATADAFRASGGTCEVRVVLNGIDPAPFDTINRAAAKSSLRNELGVVDASIVGVFSRLAHWKGQHVLVNALRNLPDVHAVFVGGALFGEDAYEIQLRQAVEDAGIEKRCHFLGFRRDIPALMAGVDIVAHTSITPEPFGRVIVEGMLSGNPVIATEGGGVNEIIVANETGLLVNPDDSIALRDAIQRLISFPEQAQAMAERGRASARRRFSLTTCLNGVEAVIAHVLR